MTDKLKELGIVSPQIAQAKAVESLSNPVGVTNRTLSNLSLKDIPRLNLIMGIHNSVGWSWLDQVTNDELNCRCSVNRKGLRGRDDLVRICQGQEESKGILDNFKDKITSFFRSGQ